MFMWVKPQEYQTISAASLCYQSGKNWKSALNICKYDFDSIFSISSSILLLVILSWDSEEWLVSNTHVLPESGFARQWSLQADVETQLEAYVLAC